MDRWDVVIVGGGPAGSAAAVTARQLGCRVLVLEASRFPRHHVGESLVYLWPVFGALGVEDVMDATFQHKRGSTRIWGTDARVRSSDFSEIAGPAPRKYSLQVERSQFDLILLRRAESVGATVLEEHRVEAVLWEGDRAAGVRHRGPDGNVAEARATVVIDASGRSCMIARERKLRRIDPFYPDLSVYGYYREGLRFDGERAGNLVLEAVPWGWLWFIPLSPEVVSVGLVCDRSSRPDLQRAGATAFLHQAIAQSAMCKRLLRSATLEGDALVTASYGYTSDAYAGEGWLLAGDAGSFFDPMWATGVGNALQDGILAGSAAEAIARDRAPEQAVTAYYDREMSRRANNINLLVKFVYTQHRLHDTSAFWQNRRRLWNGREILPADLIRLSRDPSASYFRSAFAGMGADPGMVAIMDGGIDEVRRHRASIGRLAASLDAWVPRLGPSTRLCPGLGVDGASGRLAQGLEVDNAGFLEFTCQPSIVALLSQIDGRRTARQLIEGVLDTLPPAERTPAWLTLVSGLCHAHQRGILTEDRVGSAQGE